VTCECHSLGLFATYRQERRHPDFCLPRKHGRNQTPLQNNRVYKNFSRLSSPLISIPTHSFPCHRSVQSTSSTPVIHSTQPTMEPQKDIHHLPSEVSRLKAENAKLQTLVKKFTDKLDYHQTAKATEDDMLVAFARLTSHYYDWMITRDRERVRWLHRRNVLFPLLTSCCIRGCTTPIRPCRESLWSHHSYSSSRRMVFSVFLLVSRDRHHLP
jgi:hypothetical protein